MLTPVLANVIFAECRCSSFRMSHVLAGLAYVSPDRRLVSTVTGVSALLIAPSTSISCHNGIKWGFMQPALKTAQMAVLCSRHHFVC